MPKLKIDFDRDILYEVPAERRPPGGVVCRKDKETGADVFMYKNQPGVYYSANGIEVSPALAKRAGFDVDRLEQERLKREKMRAFEADWNAKMQVSSKRVVRERGAFKLVDLGGNRYIVEDIEGNNMTVGKQATTEEMGLDWLEFFAGPEVVVPEIVNGKLVDGPDGNVSGIGGSGPVGTDRRAGSDGRAGRDLGKAVDKKAAIPA